MLERVSPLILETLDAFSEAKATPAQIQRMLPRVASATGRVSPSVSISQIERSLHLMEGLHYVEKDEDTGKWELTDDGADISTGSTYASYPVRHPYKG